MPEESEPLSLSIVYTSGNGQWNNGGKFPVSLTTNENDILHEQLSYNIARQIKATKKEDDTGEMLRNALRLSKKADHFDAINALDSNDLVRSSMSKPYIPEVISHLPFSY